MTCSTEMWGWLLIDGQPHAVHITNANNHGWTQLFHLYLGRSESIKPSVRVWYRQYITWASSTSASGSSSCCLSNPCGQQISNLQSVLSFRLTTALIRPDFRQLYEGSLKSAACLSFDEGRACVGLLCASSVNFLFTWLGLIRAGYSVLLIA